jgi:TP901 family phage tail tape measure protein
MPVEKKKISLEVELKGIQKTISEIKKVEQSKPAIDSLNKFVASLSAAIEVLGTLEKEGLSIQANKLYSSLAKIVAQVKSLNLEQVPDVIFPDVVLPPDLDKLIEEYRQKAIKLKAAQMGITEMKPGYAQEIEKKLTPKELAGIQAQAQATYNEQATAYSNYVTKKEEASKREEQIDSERIQKALEFRDKIKPLAKEVRGLTTEIVTRAPKKDESWLKETRKLEQDEQKIIDDRLAQKQRSDSEWIESERRKNEQLLKERKDYYTREAELKRQESVTLEPVDYKKKWETPEQISHIDKDFRVTQKEEIADAIRLRDEQGLLVKQLQEKLSVAQSISEVDDIGKKLVGAKEELAIRQKEVDNQKHGLKVVTEGNKLREERLKNTILQAKEEVKVRVAQNEISSITAKDIGEANAKVAVQSKNLDIITQEELKYGQQLIDLQKLKAQLDSNVKLAEKGLNNAKTENEVIKKKYKLSGALLAQAENRHKIDVTTQTLKSIDVEKKKVIESQKYEAILKNINFIYKQMAGHVGRIRFCDAELDIKRVNNELKKLPVKMREVKAKELAEHFDKAGIRVHNIGGGLQLAARGGKKLETSIGKGVREMFSMEKLISRMTFVITAKLSYQMFDTLTRALKNAIMLNVEFRNEIQKTFALIVGETEATKAHLTEQVALLAKEYRLALNDVSQAFYQIISAQIGVAEATHVLEAALKLAVGGFSSANDAALALVQILNAYELGAERAEHIADVMFQTTKLGILTTQQYADEVSKVAATASMFGISIEEISAAISVMTRNGVRVDQAFTSLNQMLMKIAKPTEKAKRMFEAYGVEINMNTVRTQGLVNTLLQLEGILESEEAMTTFMSTRTGAKAMFSLAQNAKEYASDLTNMYNSVGAASEAAESRLNTTASLMVSIKSEAIEIGRQVGHEIEPFLRTGLSLLMPILSAFRKHAPYIVSSLKMIVIQLTVIFAKKFLVSIIVFLKSMQAYILVMKSEVLDLFNKATIKAKGFGATLAQATGGLTIMVALLMQVIGWIVTATKKQKILNTDIKLGVKGIETELKGVSKEISILDSKIGALHGMRELIEQTIEFGNTIGDNIKKQEQFDKTYDAIIESIGNMLGVEYNFTDKFIGLTQIRIDAQNEELRISRQRLELKGKELALENSIAISQWRRGYQQDIDSQKIGTDFQRLRFRMFYTLDDVLEGWAIDLNNVLSNKLYKLGKEAPKYPEEPSEETLAEYHSKLATWSNRLKRVYDELEKLSDTESMEVSIVEAAKAYNDEAGALAKTLLDFSTLSESDKKMMQKSKDEWDNYIANATSFILDGLNYVQILMNSNLETINVDLETMLSQTMKDLGGRGTSKPVNKTAEIIDKWLGLLKSVDVSVETKYIDRITDLERAIDDIKKSDNQLLNEAVIEPLKMLGGEFEELGQLSDLVKKKPLDAEASVANFREMVNVYNNFFARMNEANENGERYIEQLAAELLKSGDSRIKSLGEGLVNVADRLEIELIKEIEASFVKNIKYAIRNAKDNAEKHNIYETMTKAMGYTFDEAGNIVISWFDELKDKSIKALEDIVKDDKTPETVKDYIGLLIGEQQREIADLIRAMFGKYGGMLVDLEKNMDDFADVFDYVSKTLEPLGLDLTIFQDILKAVLKNDTEALKDILFDLGEIEFPPEYLEKLQALIKLLGQLRPERYKDWTAEAQRQYDYKMRGKGPGEVPVEEMEEGEFGDFLKKKFGLDEALTLAEAFQMAESKVLELSSQVWGQYWENKIQAAEDAKERLLAIEDARQEMMLANENLSAEQRTQLQERFEERKKQITLKADKEIARERKKQAKAELTIDFAKSIATIWARELASKGGLGVITASLLTALLTGIYGAQLNIIDKQKFAGGGYTGSGYGFTDSTGYKPAGIVHEGELVIDKKTLDMNFSPLISMYDFLKKGNDFGSFMRSYVTGLGGVNSPALNKSGMFASGGYAITNRVPNEPFNVFVDFKGMRTLDDVDMSVIVEKGNRKRRVIRG